MKISYNWLKNYVEELPPPAELSEILTSCGLEVESIEHYQSVKGGMEGIFIGEVVECAKHPNADKLSLTKVNTGKGDLLSIVCGAPNVAVGQKVVVAIVGTKLTTPKGEIVLAKTKIRGEVSEGMICAEDEVGLGSSHAGIIVLPQDAAVGMPAKEYFKIEEDHIFEIGLTPNRSDATSHIGVARDIIAVINCRNLAAGKPMMSLNIPDVSNFSVGNISLTIPVVIEDEKACPRYSGVTVTGIKVAESPDWLKNKLKSIDIRPINNIVDITQYVLFETGQPLHAFDAGKITGNKVIVKKLPKDTPFVTLDGVERKLTGNDLMICNTTEGMCMAGVFGGESSGVTDSTVNIFLESACFDPATIRKTSKEHDLKTDASFRFERGTDINMTIYALKRAALLFSEIAGGQISSDIIDVCPGHTDRRKVELSYEKLDMIAGKHIKPSIAKNILASLNITIESETAGGLKLNIPTAKVDVTREIDVFEEILRIYGYNNIELPGSLRASLSYRPKPDKENIQNTVSDYLTHNGFYEIFTNSLTSSEFSEKYPDIFKTEHNVTLLNPLSKELNVMRQTLLFSGLEVIAYNQNRKNADLKLYEFGNVYSLGKGGKNNDLSKYHEHKELALFLTGDQKSESWHDKPQITDYYALKSYADSILHRIGADPGSLETKSGDDAIYENSYHYYFNGKLLCSLGTLSKKLIKDFDLRGNVQYACFDWSMLVDIAAGNKITYTEVPRFPEVRRDLALLIDDHITWKQIEDLAYDTVKVNMTKVNLFDIYTDKDMGGKKSYAVSFFLQNIAKTLTDKEIDDIMNRLITAYIKKLGATIR
jgi:phenylalanyl-tRNA synthetase beta chain